MTGSKASPVRATGARINGNLFNPAMPRVCHHCKQRFQSKRIDAKFCADLCRQAADRVNKKKASAATRIAVAKNNFNVVETFKRPRWGVDDEMLSRYWDEVHSLRSAYGRHPLVFVATPFGILILEHEPGLIRRMLEYRPRDWDGSRLPARCSDYCETRLRSNDSALQAAFRTSVNGRSFVAREDYDSFYQDLLNAVPRNVSWLYFKPFSLPMYGPDEDAAVMEGPGATMDNEAVPVEVQGEDRDSWDADEDYRPIERDWHGTVTDN